MEEEEEGGVSRGESGREGQSRCVVFVVLGGCAVHDLIV